MKTESLYTGEKISKIGFGTWRMGGTGSPDPASNADSLAALRSAIKLGYTHFDTAEMYAGGHSEELLGQAIQESGVERKSFFIASKVYMNHLQSAEMVRACEGTLRRLKMDYLDLYLIHWPTAEMDMEDTCRGFNQLVREKKVRYLGVSNFDVPLMEKMRSFLDVPIANNQAPYNLTDRTYAKNGVLDYCRKHNIVLTAYSPVRAGAEMMTQAVSDIAAAHQATPHQIALAWIVQQPGVITIPSAFSPRHQVENLAAQDIVLSPAEMDQLTV